MNFIKKFLDMQEISNPKLRVKVKTTIFASVTAVIFFASLFTVVYLLGSNMFRDKEVRNQSEMSRILATAIDSAIDKEVELLKLNANRQFVIDALKENNLKYRAKSEKQIQLYLADMNKKFIQSTDDNSFLKDYLENNLSLKLGTLKTQEEKIIAVTISDKFGGLVGSTVRPLKFYSFNQDWWLSAYAKGHGKSFIGGVEFDEASNLWCLPFAVPIEDESGSVIGIYKAWISLDTFFTPLLNFKIGESGKVSLVDDKAYLVYHDEALPFANKYCEYQEFQKILQSPEKWGLLNSAYLNRGKSLVAYSPISHPSLITKKAKWFVFVQRDLSEVFAPLDKFIFVVILIGIILVVILASFVFILSGQESLRYSMFQKEDGVPGVNTENKSYNYIEKNSESLEKVSDDKNDNLS